MMALYPDANVRLKNKNAETNDYNEIRQIIVPSASGGVEIFTHMESLRCYFIKPTGSTDYYEVISVSWSGAGASNYVMATLTSTMLEDDNYYTENNGVKSVLLVLTTKALTVGQTYHKTEF